MDLQDIGLKIKYFRKSKDLTQKEMAEKIGTTWEMVSRYETGKSSPLNRLDTIANILGIDMYKLLSNDLLAEETTSYSSASIPLITTTFNNINEALKETKHYYNAPEWIIQKYLQPFAIENILLEIQTTHIDKNGILFAVQEKPLSEKDIIIAKAAPEKLIVTTVQNLKTNQKAIATVIAWEKRFR